MVDMAATKHQATTQESPLDGPDCSWQRLDDARRSRRSTIDGGSRESEPAEADSDLPVSTKDDEESTIASADRHDEEGCDDDDDNGSAALADDGDGTPEEEEEEETAGEDNSDSDERTPEEDCATAAPEEKELPARKEKVQGRGFHHPDA